MKKVREALTCDLNSDDVFRCYLIFNRILKEDGRAATPREIIAFLNELSGIYALHKRQFSLTTIAVYICYRDALESRPETLNTDDWLDPKLRSLATDPHLERNLAAIIFNVDAELAFQILLDDRIRDAAVGEASELIEIAKAPGFDDRVNDVIEGKAQEWQSSAEFDVVVANFAALSKSHTGHSRNLYARSLVRAFLSVSEIALEPAVYDRLFSIFAFAENNDISLLVERFIRSGYESFEDTPENLMELGQNWSNYLIAVHQQLATMGHPEAINHKNIVLPFYQAPEFIFGLASGLEGTGLELSDLIVDEEYMNDDGGVLPSLAVNYPTRSVATFNHLHRNRFVSDEQWTAIGNAVVTALREPTDKAATLFGPYITLLTSIVGHTDKDHRSKIELDELYAEEVFFERLKAAAGASDRVVALAVFMAIDRFGPEGLPVVYRTQPNPQRRQITSENFTWFHNIYSGDTDMNPEFYMSFSEMVIKSRLVTKFTELGESADNNRILIRVTKEIFSSRDLPRFNIRFVVDHFNYIAACVGGEFRTTVAEYSLRGNRSELDDLAVRDIPAELIEYTAAHADGNWSVLHEHVDAMLDAVPPEDWLGHMSAGDNHAKLLLVKIQFTGFSPSSPGFREALKKFLLGVLGGEVEIVDHALNYDLVLKAIDPAYHADMFRELREEIKGVSPASLAAATSIFPTIVQDLMSADRLSHTEKDNIVRFILCPALEGNNEAVLANFEQIGRRKVRDYRNNSQESTRGKLAGAYEAYAKSGVGRERVRAIGDLFNEKKSTSSLIEFWFGGSKEAEED